MINKSSKILQIFAKEPWKKFTFKEIKTLSKSKSESYVYKVIKNFVKLNVLQQENVGNIIQYYITKSQSAISHLSIVSEQNTLKEKHLPFKEICELQSIIPIKYYTLIITGSYANKKQTSKSDLDVVIICENETKKVYAELRHFCEMSIPIIHLYAFTANEFESMLLDKQANYGKEIVRNNLIIAGAEGYYRIIQEAMKNGFNG